MIYLKKNINSKKKYKNYIYFLVIFIFFILGGLNERYDWKAQIKFFIFDAYQTIVSKIYYKSNKIEKVYLDIKLKDYKYLTSIRNDKLLRKHNEDDEKWVNIKLSSGYDNKKYSAAIKIKGQLEDHFKHEKKWSFKVKIEDTFNIKGLTRFALQPPETLDYLNEWLFIKALKKQNLIALKTDYIELIVNGENFGVYTIQETLSKETLETNKRRDSSIIGFDNDNWLKELNNYSNNSLNSMEQSYFRSKIKPVRLSKQEENSISLNLKKSIFLLDSFRKKTLKTSEVFDTNQLADALILKALFSASEFDWADMNFYFNPFTNLLEPILKEVHTIEKVESHQNNWWIDSYSILDDRTHTDYFLDQIYDDKKFYEIYLKKLNKILKDEDYIKNLIEENKDEFELYQAILKNNFPLKKIIGNKGLNVFDMQKIKMLNVLNPKIGINAFLLKIDNNNLLLNINNLQRVPVKILGLKDEKNNNEILLDQEYFIDGYKAASNPPKDNLVNIACSKNNSFCKLENIENLKVIYNYLSKEDLNYEKIEKVANDKKFVLNRKNKNIKPQQNNFIDYDIANKTYEFKKGSWLIKEDIVFDKDNLVKIFPNTELIFSNNARIISYSPISFIGTKDEPIRLLGKFNQSKNEKFTGGISVINAEKKSLMKNVICRYLSGHLINEEVIFSGAITFYNSDVEILDSFFSNNTEGDDYINIINSNFKFDNLIIENSLFDAIDLDYSDGIMSNVNIKNAGNDALDFSVSNVKLKEITLTNSNDKSISVGENSFVYGKSIFINHSNIGIASKDSSIFKGEEIQIENSKIGLAAYIKKNNYNYPFIEISKYISKENNIEFLSQKDDIIVTNNAKHKKNKFDYSKL